MKYLNAAIMVMFAFSVISCSKTDNQQVPKGEKAPESATASPQKQAGPPEVQKPQSDPGTTAQAEQGKPADAGALTANPIEEQEGAQPEGFGIPAPLLSPEEREVARKAAQAIAAEQITATNVGAQAEAMAREIEKELEELAPAAD